MPVAEDSLVGVRIGGRYEVRDAIGDGAMGSVYRARQLLLERDVALKVVRAGVDAKARRRLHREARAVARIQNPHVVQVHDFGETASDEPYLVMELVAGPTAERWLRSEPDLDAVLDAMDGVLAGLAAAHARGVLHRDLKPANMLLRDGDPRQLVLVDFGIAAVLHTGSTTSFVDLASLEEAVGPQADPELLAALDAAVGHPRRADGERLTREGTVVGTPMYMAPEQAMGRPVGPEADLYAAGVILYEWLAGVPPFRGSVMDVLYAHVRDPVPPIEPRFPVPDAVLDVLYSALSKRLAERPPSAGLMRERLRRARSQTTVPSNPVATVAAKRRPTLEPEASLRTPGEPPFVGRVSQLAVLDEALERAGEGRGGLVLVEGASGLGVSRLAAEFVARAAESGRARVGRGAATAEGLRSLREAFEDLLHTRGLGSDGLRGELDAALGGEAGLSPDEQEALVGWLRPELEAPGRSGAWVVGLLERALRVLAARSPVVLWLDDADRGGRQVAEWLESVAVAQRLEPFPLLVLASRTTLQDPSDSGPFLAVTRQVEVTRRVEVGPLEEREARELLDAQVPLTPAAAARLVERCAGSPLVAVQLIHHLRDTGRLVPVGGRFDLVEGEALDDALPSSLVELWGQRLDAAARSVPGDELGERLLDAASALGPRFRVDDLAQALDVLGVELDDDAFDEALDQLIAQGLWREVGAPGADELGWEHPALVDLQRARLVQGRRGRRRARQLAASFLEGPLASRRERAPHAVALLERIGADDLLPEPATQAGEMALQAGRLGEASRLFRLVGPDAPPPLRARALAGWGEAAQLLGHYQQGAEAYRQLDAALAEGDSLARARAGLGLGRCLAAAGKAAEAAAVLAPIVGPLQEALPDPGAARDLCRALGALRSLADRVPGVELPSWDADELLAAVSQPEDRHVVALTLGYLALRAENLPQAVVLQQTALTAARRAGHRPGIVTALYDLGWTEHRLGAVRDARAHLRECLRLAEALGRRPMQARVHNELGELLRAAGHPDEARRHYAESAALLPLVEGPAPRLAVLNLAIAELDAGDDAAATERLDRFEAAGHVAPWLHGPFALTRAVCAALLDPEGAHESMRTGVDALAGGSGGGDEAARLLERLATRFEEGGRIEAAEEARRAREALHCC